MVAARNNLGLCLRHQGDLAGAIASFQAVTSKQPNFQQAWANLGNALRAGNETDQAIECFNRALQIDPQCTDALCNLGHAKVDVADFVAAEGEAGIAIFTLRVDFDVPS